MCTFKSYFLSENVDPFFCGFCVPSRTSFCSSLAHHRKCILQKKKTMFIEVKQASYGYIYSNTYRYSSLKTDLKITCFSRDSFLNFLCLWKYQNLSSIAHRTGETGEEENPTSKSVFRRLHNTSQLPVSFLKIHTSWGFWFSR